MSIEIGDGGLGYIYLGDVLIAGGGGGEKNYKLLYCPLTSDTLDHSGNNISLTSSGTISYTTLSSGKSVASFSGGQIYTGNDYISQYLSSHIYTVSHWANVTKNSASRRNHFVIGSGTTWYGEIESGLGTLETRSGVNGVVSLYGDNDVKGASYTGWHHYCVVVNGGTTQLYVDGQATINNTITARSNGWLGIGMALGGSSSDAYYGYMSEFIVENKARTATEISKYFNQTKGKYGL